MTTTEAAKQKPSKWPVFLRKGRIAGFLTVVMAGQLVYSSFEAFKGSLIVPMTETLGITNEQYGILFSWIGIAMFLYVPAGWINNRFTIRNILLAWSAWRLVTFLMIWLLPLNFTAMAVIAATWGIWDAIGWPAVVNGVSFMAKDSDTKGRGMAMGLLETIRRAAEFLMNLVIIGLLAAMPQNTKTIMVIFGVTYALLLIPLMVALLRVVPANAIAHDDKVSDNVAALYGLAKVLAKPNVWMSGLAGLAVYWCYINLFWSSAPYLQKVYEIPLGVSSAFGIFNTAAVGIFAGLASGFLADYLFKSSTVMLGTALALVTGASIVVYLLPNDSSAMWPAIILLIIMSFGIFMGKAVILAPIAELHLPEGINGSAMAVGSFLVYAPVFWANQMNGRLLDLHKGQEYLAYQEVFLITVIVGALGAACALGLVIFNRRQDKKALASTGDNNAANLETANTGTDA